MIRTDVCSNCHPFFTGEQRIVDTAGQVDRFMKRLGRYGQHQEEATQRQKELRTKAEQRFLRQQLAALDLNSALAQVLHDANIVSIGDVIKKLDKDRDGLLALEEFEAKDLDEIETKLAEAREAYFADL
jgi:large subunit ribosomal protein L31